jgi:hypothetical protein
MARLSSSELANWDGRYTHSRHNQDPQYHDRNEQSSVPGFGPMSTCTDTKLVTVPAAVANLEQRGTNSRRIGPEEQQARVVDRQFDFWWLTRLFFATQSEHVKKMDPLSHFPAREYQTIDSHVSS